MGPSTILQVSAIRFLKSHPSLATREGFVVTPSSTPQLFTSLMCSRFAVSMNIFTPCHPSLLPLEYIVGSFHDVVYRKSVFAHQLIARARLAEDIRYPHALHGHMEVLDERHRNRTAHAHHHGVLLGRHDPASLPGCLHDRLLVERLDCVQVDDPRVDPVLGQLVSSLEALGHHDAAADERDV